MDTNKKSPSPTQIMQPLPSNKNKSPSLPPKKINLNSFKNQHHSTPPKKNQPLKSPQSGKILQKLYMFSKHFIIFRLFEKLRKKSAKLK